jgi:hypothetical protein
VAVARTSSMGFAANTDPVGRIITKAAMTAKAISFAPIFFPIIHPPSYKKVVITADLTLRTNGFLHLLSPYYLS